MDQGVVETCLDFKFLELLLLMNKRTKVLWKDNIMLKDLSRSPVLNEIFKWYSTDKIYFSKPCDFLAQNLAVKNFHKQIPVACDDDFPCNLTQITCVHAILQSEGVI